MACIVTIASRGQLPPPREVPTYRLPATTQDSNSAEFMMKYGNLFHVHVQVDGETVASAAANYPRDLEELLRSLAIRYAVPTRRFNENGVQLPLPVVRIAVWDIRQQEWYHPGRVKMGDDWDGWLTVEVDVRVGSSRF